MVHELTNDNKTLSAIELEIDIRKIMFCTLNTPKIDMRHLLSGLVVYNDFIFVHIQGQARQVCTEILNSLHLSWTIYLIV